MSVRLQPVCVATGNDEEGLPVFDQNQRLLAALTFLWNAHYDAMGQWLLVGVLGPLGSCPSPFADPNATQTWISEHLVQQARVNWRFDRRLA